MYLSDWNETSKRAEEKVVSHMLKKAVAVLLVPAILNAEAIACTAICGETEPGIVPPDLACRAAGAPSWLSAEDDAALKAQIHTHLALKTGSFSIIVYISLKNTTAAGGSEAE